MAFLDRSGVLARISPASPVSIELGCGPSKANPEAIGIDAIDFPGVDLVGDVFEVLGAMPSGSVARCSSSHFLEHVPNLTALFDEFERVLVVGGEVVATVPHFSNPYFYSDPTHCRTFGLYSMSYLAVDRIFRRRVPLYGRRPRLELIAVVLGFNSPFPLRRLVKRSVGPVFNLGRWTQEFYEENVSHLFPCYEITYRLTRLADNG